MTGGDTMYNALDVAKYIITYCKKNQKPISNLKLQKLLYFVQAQFLVSENHACFNNRIEAWDLGPVVPDVYHQFKVYGSNPIILWKDGHFGISTHDRNIIDSIVDDCNQYTASQLVDLTHLQTPWIQAREKAHNGQITNESIREFFY